jgi:hypothetical protein
MRRLFILSGLMLAGCNVASAEHDQIGRFAYYPASGEMPAVLVDTRTGCIERLVKMTSVDNPSQIWWVRQYMDGTLPGVADGKEVPNSRPPARCAADQGSTK